MYTHKYITHTHAVDEDMSQQTTEFNIQLQKLSETERSKRALETMCEQLTEQLKILQVCVVMFLYLTFIYSWDHVWTGYRAAKDPAGSCCVVDLRVWPCVLLPACLTMCEQLCGAADGPPGVCCGPACLCVCVCCMRDNKIERERESARVSPHVGWVHQIRNKRNCTLHMHEYLCSMITYLTR